MIVAIADTHAVIWYLFSDPRLGKAASALIDNAIANGDHILLMDYGPKWRDTRKLLHNNLMEKVVDERCVPLQEAEAKQLLHDYLIEPQNFMDHPKRYSNSPSSAIHLFLNTQKARSTPRHQATLDMMSILMCTVVNIGTPHCDNC